MRKFLKAISILVTAFLVAGAFSACDNSGSSSTITPEPESSSTSSQSEVATSSSEPDTSSTEAQKVSFWYYHKGDEAAPFEAAVKAFNEKQSDYVVEGFSVPDKQKYLVAISTNDVPDVIQLSNHEMPSYYANGLLENLSELGSKNNFDFGVFSESATKANSMDGNFYSLPETTVIIQMFYNKDILESIGETEPPKTMEELYDMAVRATTLDANGDIDVLGYPLFPLASARQEGIFAFGGTWVDPANDTTPTANSQNVLASLNMNVKYREQYGIEQVQKFVATGNTNRYTPQDIFFAGKQLFRFDGPWLATMAKENNPDLNYDVTLIPGTNADPDLRGVSRYENVSLAIPITAKNKEGGWELLSYLVTDGAKDVCLGIGSLPANTSLYADEEILASNPVFPQFIEALYADNGVQAIKLADSAQYISLIEEHLDYVYNGTKTPEEAMESLQKQAEQLS